ncbi:MAG: DUF642 domain-containing protein [bacterium]|nr:DUF642 domain-containing protein [bacterium]
MKKILLSLAAIVTVAVVVTGATIAFYNDTETSAGNIFVAGSVDLKVDHTYASYDGEECVGNCTEQGSNLVLNEGFENPVVTDNGGQWQIYPSGISNWAVTAGAGLELQRNGVAGAPHGGQQLAELDSHGAGSQSTIEQVINTVPGQKYRLTFWHSPRPANTPNNGEDNQIEFTIEVTSNSGVLVNNTIGMTYSGSGTSWTQYTYNFIALDTQTTIIFADAGTQADTLGGYIDDVSVRELSCPENDYPNGGICTLWGEQDLGQGDTFWNFPDIKPGDWGTNVISLHVYGNDAFACLLPSNLEDNENTPIEPEVTAGDTTADGIQNGELSGELEFFMWEDANGNNAFDLSEQILVTAGTPFNQIPTQMVAMSLTGNAPITLVGMSWCAGDQTLVGTTVNCDGNGMGDIAQTDKMVSDFVAYAVQQRNNSNFTCADANIPLLVAPENL